MPHPSYSTAYPRAGDAAILCEGDLVGYEASILQKWADRNLGTDPLVDIWPCGTASSIFGISDAIGRSRPILVVEDRDFRSEIEAERDCKNNRRDREGRDIRIVGWRTWKRNEIENYLLQPEVVLDTMADVFQCRQDDVHTALQGIIQAQSVSQAVSYALYRIRRAWIKTEPSGQIQSMKLKWNDSEGRPILPDNRDAVREILRKDLDSWLDSNQKEINGSKENFLLEFDQKCDEWNDISFQDETWLLEWSGKDLLQWLRVWMTAHHGWKNGASTALQKRNWESLKRKEFDAQDREIENILRPFLVDKFLAHLSSLKPGDGDLYEEWRDIANQLLECKRRTK